MNAVIDTLPSQRAPVAAPHATHKFKLLLRREFWEHKGGFLWAPLVAGGISLLLTVMAIVVGEVAARRAIASGKLQMDDVMVNGLDAGNPFEHLLDQVLVATSSGERDVVLAKVLADESPGVPGGPIDNNGVGAHAVDPFRR